MYDLKLDQDELRLHVNSLDANVRLICQQIASAQSSGFALKNMLSQLIRIDQQFDKLQKVLETTNERSQVTSGAS